MVSFISRYSLLCLCIAIIISGCNTNPHKASVDHKPLEQKAGSIQLPEDAIAFTYRSGGIFIELSVNDSIKGQFLFDTGSDQLYLDSQFVDRSNLSLNYKSSKEIFGVGEGTQMVPTVGGIALSLDKLQHDYHNVPVTNIRAISGNHIDGVFGTELFKPYILDINFDSSYFRIIYDTLNFKAPARYDSVKLHYLGKTKTVIKCQASLNDSIHVSGWTILDLGSGGSLTLTSVIGKEYGLETAITNKYEVVREMGGYGGRTASWYFRADSINFGNTMIEKPVMNYSTDSKGYLSFWGFLGLMGTKVIERYNIIFDFFNHRFYYSPNESFNKEFTGNMAGFHAKKILNDSLKRIKVYNVIEGSPAHLAGLIKGDIITHIDGVAISQLSEKERKQIFTQESIPVVLHFERNGEKHKASILPHRII
jgi:hypothetical protein